MPSQSDLMQQRFAQRVALVTGGAQGIGRATCQRLAREGACVAVADVNQQTGAAAAEELRNQGLAAEYVPLDVRDEASIARAVATVVDRWQRIDVLVNNASVFVFAGVDATQEQWDEILQVNVRGMALVAKHVVPVMQRQGRGAIVNLGSISSFIAQPGFLTYNTTKAAVTGLTRCMALDLAGDGIRVNAVCPGTVWTPIVERLTREQGLDRQAADRHADWGGKHMLGRLADAEEVAAAIAFLASDDASFITAECLMVDGGYIAQ